LSSNNVNPFEYQFPEPTLQELHDLLGEKFDAALPSLKLAANICSARPFSKISSSARKDVTKLLQLLKDTEDAIAALSPEARALLHDTTDYDASAAAHVWVADAKAAIEAWRIDYNTVRPHSSLAGRTPNQFAAISVGTRRLTPARPQGLKPEDLSLSV